ncbi:hypothetical protein Tco_0322849, partial [Tanacetum coccineum]
MLGYKKYIKYNGVRNISYPMWVLFREGLYGERLKLGGGVDDEEENNQRIDYGSIITLRLRKKRDGQ